MGAEPPIFYTFVFLHVFKSVYSQILRRAPNMVKRVYQKSRVLGGGLPILRFIFDEIR